MLAILGGGLLLLGVREGLLVLGVSGMLAGYHREKRNDAARKIQRMWQVFSTPWHRRRRRVRRQWREREDPMSVMGRVTAWDNVRPREHLYTYDHDTVNPYS